MAGDDQLLLRLLHAIAAGDGPATRKLLRAHPELATTALGTGATRQQSVEFFLDDIKHHVYKGDTALHVAAAAHDADLVTDLVAAGASVASTNRRGAQPLHYAVDGDPARSDERAQRDTVELLIEYGADVNAPDKNGTTPLLRAVRNRCAVAVQTLLDADADVTITNARGSTAVQLASVNSGKSGSGSAAAHEQQQRIVELLQHAAG